MDAFTGGAGNDTFVASVATMGALDVIDGGAGTDTLNVRDSGTIATLPGTISGVENVNITSTAGSVGVFASVAASPAVAQQIKFTFDTNYGTSVGAGPVAVTVGAGTLTVGTDGNPVNLQSLASAIQTLLGSAGTASGTNATTGSITVTSSVAGTALPSISFANGTYTAPGSANATATNTTIDVTAATNYSFRETIVANQAAVAATSASTVSIPAGATTVSIESAADARVASVSTAATTVFSGGPVSLSGGASQTITAFDSVSVSGGVGPISVATGRLTSSSTAIPASSTLGWTEAPGVFIRGGTTVSLSESAGTSTAGSLPSGNSTKIQIGANPGSATGADANGAVTSNAQTGAQVVGNLSSAPTGDVSVVVRTNYTGNNTNTATNSLTNVRYGTGQADIFMNGGTTASVTGAGTVNITDLGTVLRKASTIADALPGTSKLTTVNLTGVSGTTTIKSDVMSTISVVDSTGGNTVTVTSNTGANTGAIALNVANSTVTLSHANATSVAIGAAAGSGRQAIGSTLIPSTQASTVTLTAAKATSLSFSGANSVALAASTLTELTSITSTASGTVTLGTPTDYTKLTSVNMSGGTGAVTASIGATITSATTDRAFAYTGSQGADTVTLTGQMKSGTNSAGAVIQNTINLGAGNDTLLSNSGSIAAGAVVNGGDGTDTIAASLLTAGNAAQITGFEVLGLDLTTGTYDTDLLVGATGLAMVARGGTYTNVEPAQALTVVSGANATNDATVTTLTFTASAVSGSSDAYTVTFAQSAPTSTATSRTNSDAGVVVLAGIETINVVSGGTGFLNNHITLTGANARNVVLSGAQNLSIDFSTSFGGTTAATATNGLGVASIDGSAMTGRLTVNTANVLEAWTSTTILGGTNDDAITLSALAGKAVVNAGAGADTITSAAASSSQTGGAGKDTFDVTAAVAMTGGVATDSLTTITDFVAGDVIDFIGGTSGTHTATSDSIARLTLTTEATLAAAITSALNASPKNTGGAKEVVWFVYGGNTYVTFDASDDTGTNGGMANGDIVVVLTGVVDLTNATFDATNGSLVIPGG